MSDSEETAHGLHPDLVQLSLRRPTIGVRVMARIAREPSALGALAERVGRAPHEARLACECEDVLVAEVSRALEAGARSVAEVVSRTGLGRGACGGAGCLDALALHVARRTGRETRVVLEEAAALRPDTGSEGPDRGLAHIALAYARLADDAFDDEDEDDEPELVVGRGRR